MNAKIGRDGLTMPTVIEDGARGVLSFLSVYCEDGDETAVKAAMLQRWLGVREARAALRAPDRAGAHAVLGSAPGRVALISGRRAAGPRGRSVAQAPGRRRVRHLTRAA